MAIVYAATAGFLVWWLKDDYIEFCVPVRTHALNAALMVVLTGLILAFTWNLVQGLFSLSPGGPRIQGRWALRLVLLYVTVPCAIFVARYGVIDLGDHQLARWPLALAGWMIGAAAAGYLLFTAYALR